MDPATRVGLSLFPEVDGDDLVSHASRRSPEFRLRVACQFRDVCRPKGARVEPEVYYSLAVDL